MPMLSRAEQRIAYNVHRGFRTGSRLNANQRECIIHIALRRLKERDEKIAALEKHQNEQRMVRTHLRLSGRPILDAGGNLHFLDL